jgi:hypothetical protein
MLLMVRHARLVHGSIAVVALCLVLGAESLGAPRPAEAASANLQAWTGGVDLYRRGVFTTQKSWLWCTAAGVQMMRNIADRETDHSTAGQRRYFAWMRDRNRYDLPLSAGVDPEGWAAGLRHFVDDRYRLVSSRTFDSALRTAVTRMRLTNLPVALTVSHGNHGWVLNGFRATADPAETSSFRITSVRVSGPLYGLQSKNGYDMPPDTKLTTAQLKRFFTPWKYAPKSMVWDGRYVSIQPVPLATSPGPSSPIASTTVTPRTSPDVDPSPVSPPSAASATSSPSLGAALGGAEISDRPSAPRAIATAPTAIREGSFPVPALVAGALTILAFSLLAVRVRRRDP